MRDDIATIERILKSHNEGLRLLSQTDATIGKTVKLLDERIDRIVAEQRSLRNLIICEAALAAVTINILCEFVLR